MSHSTEAYSTLPLGTTHHILVNPTSADRVVHFLCGKHAERLELEYVGPHPTIAHLGRYRRAPKPITLTSLDSPHLCRSCAHALMIRKRLCKPGTWPSLGVTP